MTPDDEVAVIGAVIAVLAKHMTADQRWSAAQELMSLDGDEDEREMCSEIATMLGLLP
jgi:hypothetical protein